MDLAVENGIELIDLGVWIEVSQGRKGEISLMFIQGDGFEIGSQMGQGKDDAEDHGDDPQRNAAEPDQ